MTSDGKYTPLNLNCLGELLQGHGLQINPKTATFMGTSTGLSNYTVASGAVVYDTVLRPLNTATRLAWTKLQSSAISQTVYNNLVSIGSTTIPALGNSKPSTYTKTYSNELASYGWLRLLALQAHNEFYINSGSYSDFLNTFNTCYSSMKQSNIPIQAFVDSLTYMDGTYSNMNDLITSDITGVSLSTFHWGQDLIASGKAIDLTSIDSFGDPANLIRTMNKYKAITKSVNLALLNSGIDVTVVQNIINNNPISISEQQSIYAAFCIITGEDLADVLLPLNCQTKDLQSLADLLNPKKLFPNSYQTLTIPVYNTNPGPTNSKTYYLLYESGQVNFVNPIYSERLNQVMPFDIAYACDAFGTSMMQIKNIKSMMIEKFSQVVTNLENVNDLNVNGTSKPGDTPTSNSALALIGLGTGENGLYTMCDFFGCMTDLHYDWKKLQTLITSLTTANLTGCYNNILTILQGTNYSQLQLWIDNANTEINNIFNPTSTYYKKRVELNTLYEEFGKKLLKEQNARTFALGDLTYLTTTVRDLYGFMGSLNQYSLETEKFGPAQVLESISNKLTLGGESLIGSMRENRNANRLGLTGAEQDNSVDNTPLKLPKTSGSIPTTPSGLPLVTEGPLVGVIAITGAVITPGSLAGSQETTLIPNNLDIFNIANTPLLPSVINPKDAVQSVIDCNCDCWDLLTP